MNTARVQVWEVVHKGGGYAAVILAIAAMFTGFHAFEEDAGGARVGVARGLFAAWVACGGLLFIGLAVRQACAAPAKTQAVRPVAVPVQVSELVVESATVDA